MSQTKNRTFRPVDTIDDDVPVLYIGYTDQRSSGMIEEGTERLAQPNEKTAPGLCMLRSDSHFFLKEDGKARERVNIRHIFGVPEIEVNKQKEKGFEPQPVADTIILKDGYLAVAREGNTIRTYDYLKKCSFNESNPDRDPTVQIRFREIEPETQHMSENDLSFEIAEAIMKVKALQSKEKGEVVYDEAKLNAYVNLFNIAADGNGAKVSALIAVASRQPIEFMNKVKLLDQKFEMEILTAEELELIKYNKNTIEYVHKPEVILTVTGAFLSKDQLRAKLAAFFQSQEGAVAYQSFLIELEAFKAKKLN